LHITWFIILLYPLKHGKERSITEVKLKNNDFRNDSIYLSHHFKTEQSFYQSIKIFRKFKLIVQASFAARCISMQLEDKIQ
jgi:hypothetical protein